LFIFSRLTGYLQEKLLVYLFLLNNVRWILKIEEKNITELKNLITTRHFIKTSIFLSLLVALIKVPRMIKWYTY